MRNDLPEKAIGLDEARNSVLQWTIHNYMTLHSTKLQHFTHVLFFL